MTGAATPVAEITVARTQMPFGERWRWQLTWFWPTDPIHPGVYDGRLHIRSEHGYTWSRRGAWRQVQRASYRRPTREQVRT